jgi:hypothetical protein
MLKKQLMSTKNCDKPYDKTVNCYLFQLFFSDLVCSPPCSLMSFPAETVGSSLQGALLTRLHSYSISWLPSNFWYQIWPKSSIVDLMISCHSKVLQYTESFTGKRSRALCAYCLCRLQHKILHSVGTRPTICTAWRNMRNEGHMSPYFNNELLLVARTRHETSDP